jgi:hypothetical protein
MSKFKYTEAHLNGLLDKLNQVIAQRNLAISIADDLIGHAPDGENRWWNTGRLLALKEEIAPTVSINP